MAPEPPWRTMAGGIVLSVRLTPKGGRDALDGIMPLANGRQVLAARVRAAPEAGAANGALLGLIAEVLGVARRDVSLVTGTTSRIKTVHVSGDAEALSAQMTRLTQTDQA